MNNRQEHYETARIQLGNTIHTLLSIHTPCGVWMNDLKLIQKILDIIIELGPEEAASIQLKEVDKILGWHGTGKGRIEKIKELTNVHKQDI